MNTRQRRGRPNVGVIATIRVRTAKVTLVFRDASHESERDGWKDVRLFTEKPFSRASFTDRTLRREDYEDIGFNLVNRLCALAGLEPSSASAPRPVRKPSLRKRR